MVTPELAAYIMSERNKGVADHIIKMNLRSQGWLDSDFDEAAATLPPRPTQTRPLSVVEPENVPQEKKIADFRTLSEKTIWRKPDGSADTVAPAQPATGRVPMPKIVAATTGSSAIKTVFAILFICASIAAVIYRNLIWPPVMSYISDLYGYFSGKM